MWVALLLAGGVSFDSIILINVPERLYYTRYEKDAAQCITWLDSTFSVETTLIISII